MRPHIVVLDGYALQPGDLTWDDLHALGECVIFGRTPENEVVARAGQADIVLTNKVPLSAETLSRLANLKYIGVLATGYNVVDVVAAKRQGVCVTNVPGYGAKSVAQHALALLLELTNHVGFHAYETSSGAWSHSADWCYWKQPLVELDGLSLGILGYGEIGRTFAGMARGLGMKILTVRRKSDLGPEVEQVTQEELFRRSDVLSLHCPLTPETRHIVGPATLPLMKKTAFLINTARGLLIDEVALAEALRKGTIAGAVLDVLSVEPPPSDHSLQSIPNCVITPHQAWATRAARSRLLSMAIANVHAFLAGHPEHVVG